MQAVAGLGDRSGAVGRRAGAVAATVLAFAMVVVVGAGGPDPASAGAPPGVRGVVREPGGAVVAGAMIAALRTTDFVPVGTAVADGSGAYELDGVPAGSYHLYLIDPDGARVAGFHGDPATITVSSGWTEVDPVLQPANGAVGGEVTSEGGGALADVLVVALGATDGRILGATATDEDGRYQLGPLPSRPVLVGFVHGGHAPEYHDDTTIGQASAVAVPAGGEVTVDAELAPTEPVDVEATLAGSITQDGSADPVRGWVVSLDAQTFQPEGAVRADATGAWSLPVDAGGHRVVAFDPDRRHAGEWHPDVPQHELASSGVVDVAVGGTATVDHHLAPTTGVVQGTVVEDGSGDLVEGAWAIVITSDGVLATTTDEQGEYRLDDVPAGDLRATFLGPDGVQLQEYWDGGATPEQAEVVALVGGGTQQVDISLAGRPCGTTVPAPPTRCMVAAPAAPGPAWATWTISPGAQTANAPVHGAQAPSTLHGWFVSPGRLARRYQFAFDGSARYVLTDPTQPEDQLDWNKLPGLSDCGTNDLSVNGWMFAWRWRTDLTPRVLEITAYANNDGTHLWADEPLLTLTSAQLDARLPLWFDLRVSTDRSRYEFTVRGPGTRLATTTLQRACTTASPSWQWPGGFYFGGTSTAPSTITGLMRELPA